MKTSTRAALAAAITGLSQIAFAHAALVDSFPAKGAVLAGSPTEIHLTFSERVAARGCRIKLVSDAGKYFDADRAAPDRKDPNTLVAAVPVLKPGVYSARWTAVGKDGHKTRGDFSFTVSK
jgi:methionine-rich copper-binding protein CopC